MQVDILDWSNGLPTATVKVDGMYHEDVVKCKPGKDGYIIKQKRDERGNLILDEKCKLVTETITGHVIVIFGE